MSYVVTENCIQCKFTHCVNACPVIAFHEGENYLVINPVECIDCGLCVDECDASAIFAEDMVPADQQHFIEINARLSETLPVILASKDPLPDANSWLDRENKFTLMAGA